MKFSTSLDNTDTDTSQPHTIFNLDIWLADGKGQLWILDKMGWWRRVLNIYRISLPSIPDGSWIVFLQRTKSKTSSIIKINHISRIISSSTHFHDWLIRFLILPQQGHKACQRKKEQPVVFSFLVRSEKQVGWRLTRVPGILSWIIFFSQKHLWNPYNTVFLVSQFTSGLAIWWAVRS